MRRRPLLEAILLGVLLPLWMVCAALHINAVVRGRLAYFPVYVTPAAPGAHPTVSAFWPDTVVPDTGLALGDELVAAGDTRLDGAGRFGVLSGVYAAADAALNVPLTVRRGGEQIEVALPLRPVAFPWRTLPLVLGLGATCGLALLRARGSRAARAYSIGGFAYSLHWSLMFGGAPWQTTFGLAVFFVFGALFAPLVLRATLLFPGNLAPRNRFAMAWPWIFLGIGPGLSSWMIGFPLPGEVGLRVLFALNVGFMISLFAIVAGSYARADALGRRKLKWVLFGFYAGLAPVAVGGIVASIRPDWWWVYELSLLSTILIPICIFIAIVAYQFLDIDRLISITAAYTVLTAVFLAGVFTVVPALADWVSEWVRVEPSVAQGLLSVALAGSLVPARRYVGEPVERLLFRERHQLERGVGSIRRELSRLSDPADLHQMVGEQLQRLLRLDRCVVYRHVGEAFAPVYSHGPAVPPGFDATGRLVTLLEEKEEPVDAATWYRWCRRGLVEGADRASLESLDSTVLVPIRRRDELVAFVCLGEKGSGDVFTPTDLALLDGLAASASETLQRFDEAEMASERRAMQEALEGYVPGAVAEELSRGVELEQGEREVTVLFVDMRGYTAFSEGRTASEIFSVVNAYTTAVSTLIREYGGSVVEFHGDGLMAVFGAPRPIDEKERAAIGASRAICDAMADIPVPERAGSQPLEVGVGIATGLAFVGDIQAIDRKIWGVIGNTTNLAARLQGLTRGLDAAVVVDDLTYERAARDARDFDEKDGIEVRGRSELLTIHALPLAAQEA